MKGPCICDDLDRVIAFLIDVRDRLEPDPDAEPDDADEDNGDAEPSLGSLESHPRGCDVRDVLDPYRKNFAYLPTPYPDGSQAAWGNSETSDAEDEHDGREPDADNEPSLGSRNPTVSGSQASWGAGNCYDLEHEHDGREPEDGA